MIYCGVYTIDINILNSQFQNKPIFARGFDSQKRISNLCNLKGNNFSKFPFLHIFLTATTVYAAQCVEQFNFDTASKKIPETQSPLIKYSDETLVCLHI